MRIFRLFFFAALFVPAITSSVNADPISDRMIERIRILASPEMAGRGSGSPGMYAAADSIAAWMDDAGLERPPGAVSRFFDFPLAGPGYEGLTGRNVLGWKPGGGEFSESYAVIGAHYDHLGLEEGCDVAAPGTYYPGAEDNASGVVMMLEMAGSAFSSLSGPHRGCLFVAFAGEEIGLQGSAAMVENLPIDLERVDFMLNLDSVGRLRDDRLYIGGLGSSPNLRSRIIRHNDGHGSLDLQLSDSGWDASDHVSFNAAGVPVLFLFTGPHPQYHSVEDTWDLVPADGLHRVFLWSSALLTGLVVDRDAFPYTPNATLPAHAAPGEPKKTRAWLGTIPDFVEDVVGVKLSGVMPGGPAEEAGLVAGDILIGFGEMEITDLKDLTVALQTHGSGEMIRVRYIRDGEERVIPVTLRERPR